MSVITTGNSFCQVVRRVRVVMRPYPLFKVACRNAYATILDRLVELAPLPRSGFAKVELDQWVRGDPGFYIGCLHDSPEEDFADLDPDAQAWFVALGNEALFGPKRDDSLLREIIDEFERIEV